MSDVRVTPWHEETLPPPPDTLLEGMKARRPNKELIGIDRVLLRSLPLAEGWNGLLGRIRADFDLKLEYRELMMLRVAVLNGADFEWDVHYPAYLQAGGTEEKALAVKDQDTADHSFNEEERALIMLADQSTKHVDVDEGVIDALKTMFGEAETVEAVATVAAYNMVSRFLVALAI